MISKFSVKKPYTVLVAVVMVIVLGVVSFSKMTTDLLPDINLPYVVVLTTYGGASPETVETVVTRPVEESMATVSNIENVSSSSSENYSMVVLEFAQSTNMDSVSLEIREKIDQIKGFWPDEVGNPIIMKLNPDMLPVMVAAVGMEGMDNKAISEMTEKEIVPELESIEGVASVDATGLTQDSVHVIIRQEKIDAINKEVFGAIDGEMEEARQELADGKAELEEKEGDLAEARKKIADSRADLESGRADLEKGKTELEDKKNQTTSQIAEGSAALISGNAKLEANKAALQSKLSELQLITSQLVPNDLRKGITQIDSIITQIEILKQTLPEGGQPSPDVPEGPAGGAGDIVLPVIPEIPGLSGNGVAEGVPPAGAVENGTASGGTDNGTQEGNGDSQQAGEAGQPQDGAGDDVQNGKTPENAGQQNSGVQNGKTPENDSQQNSAAGETGRPEIAAGETGPAQNAVKENGAAQKAMGEAGSARNTAGETGLTRNAAGEAGPAQNAAGENDLTLNTEGETGPVQNAAGEYSGPGRGIFRLPALAAGPEAAAVSYLESSGLLLAAADDDTVMRAILQDPGLTGQISAVLGNADWMNQTLDGVLNALQSAKAGLEKGIQTLEEAEEGISQIEDALHLLNEKGGQVTDGLTELEKGKLTAAIEFANGKSQLSLAEAQLKTGELQLDSTEEQLKSGEEQIESVREQLADGEEQLEEAREQAFAKADMNGVLTVDTVKSLLTAQNFSMPGGYVTEKGIEYLVRVGEKPDDVEELKKMPLLNLELDGLDVIRLADVADVFMTDNTDEIYTNVNGSPGIMLSIQKQTGYSTGEVSDKLSDKFRQLMEERDGLSMITLMDQGIYIDLVMDSILSSLLWGGLLAILILILFLRDIRPTLVIACSIPISLVTAIVCMYFSGVTLNIISLSGLALGIGMLVDNSIVVIENIYRLRNEGRSMKEAAVEGAGEVAGAILASTLTTVCVFAPIIFTEGITRQLFVDMGLTIAYSLLSSLIVALTLVPAMASGTLRRTKVKEEGRFLDVLRKSYVKALDWSLRHKAAVLISVVILLAGSALASFSRGTAFMSDMDSTQLSMTVTMEKGTPVSETGQVTDQILERVRTLPQVQDVGAMTGGGGMSSMMGGGSTNVASVYVTLQEDKEKSNDELAAEILAMNQDLLEQGVGITVDTSSMDMTSMMGDGISIQVRGREIDTLQEIAKEVAAIVAETEGTAEVSDGIEETTEELRVLVDRDKAIDHGLTVAQVYQQIAAKLKEPSSATELSTSIRDYDVYVINGNDLSLKRNDVRSMELSVQKEDGTTDKVPLRDIAAFEDKEGLKSIQREDQTRYVQISAGIAEGYNVGLVSSELEKNLTGYELPKGYSLEFAGENEMINDAIGQVMLMLILALVFMYLIMVAQFQSLLSPFIIMFTIPLAFTGGFLGLYLSGSEVSVVALIGFVMLSGIIVNNGIVLVDYINQLRQQGMEKRRAILESGSTRLRPVLMTALTTILALSTMVFSHDMGSEMAKPMAIVTIGGLIYGTLLTLIVVPCIYDLFMRKKKKGEDNDGFRESAAQEAEPGKDRIIQNENRSSGKRTAAPDKKEGES